MGKKFTIRRPFYYLSPFLRCDTSSKQLSPLKITFIFYWTDGKSGKRLIQFAKLESSSCPFLNKLLDGLDNCDELAYPHGK